MGLEVMPSVTNFIGVDVGQPSGPTRRYANGAFESRLSVMKRVATTFVSQPS